MPPPEDIENKDLDTTQNDTTATVADTVQVDDIKTGSDNLDAQLDRLAGIKPNEATKAGTSKEVQGKQGIVPADKDKTTQEPQPQQQRPVGPSGRTPITPRAYPKGYKVDANNNVVDAATGAVLATAGGQRSYFERTVMPYVESIRSRADKAEAMYEAATKANTIATSLGLNPDEYALGSRIIAAFKSDPKKAIQFLLTEAQNNGIDTSDFGVIGGGISPAVVEQLLDKKLEAALKPFLGFAEDRENERQYKERESAAEEGVHNFLERYPDAEMHGLHIANIMKHHAERGEDIDMDKAYLLLRNHALTNGFDWTKDLAPQVAAKDNGGKRTTTAPNVGTGRNLPNLNGRQGNDQIVAKPKAMSGLADTDEIVRETLREFGVIVN